MRGSFVVTAWGLLRVRGPRIWIGVRSLGRDQVSLLFDAGQVTLRGSILSLLTEACGLKAMHAYLLSYPRVLP